MKNQRDSISYSRKLKRAISPTLKTFEHAKLLNLRMVKVCFGPCKCFSAPKR